jgi:hypothetical protein
VYESAKFHQGQTMVRHAEAAGEVGGRHLESVPRARQRSTVTQAALHKAFLVLCNSQQDADPL